MTTLRPEPALVRTRAELRRARERAEADVAVVMTMGALHAGHVALLRAARLRAATVVVTVFVNPAQFVAGEDLERYPRTLDADLSVCATEGVDVVFAPTELEIYGSSPPAVTVTAGRLGAVLEGASRPGHFDGVLTIVAKLLHLVRPDAAFFGEKDAQQLVLVRRMVADLDFEVDIVGIPTVREPGGLALSSRNSFLDPGQRPSALVLSRALHAGAAMAGAGPAAVRRAALDVLDAEGGVTLDYLALVDPVTLDEVADEMSGPAVLAVAARVGSTRLIDNQHVLLGEA